MHILIVSHGYPTPQDPQWGCFEKDQAEALVKLGHKVTIAAVDGRNRRFKRKIGIQRYTDYEIQGYVSYYFPLGYLYFSSLRHLFRERMMIGLFERIKRDEGLPVVIYAHYSFGMAELGLVKAKYHIPILGIEHWSELNKVHLPKTAYDRCLQGYNLVDKLLAVSPSLQAQIKKHFGKESEVVYDMVNEVFLDAEIKAKKYTSPFRFIGTGSLIHRKGFDILLLALSKMRHKDIELHIVGDGSDKAKLEDLSKQLKIEEMVFFHGRLNKEEMIAIMNNCNAFCLPSRDETFGVAHIEALAMGLPVIATICGGPEHFINADNGILVKVDDVDGLTMAMDNMVDDIDKYNPIAIREYVRSRFSGIIIAKKVEYYLNEVINNKKEI